MPTISGLALSAFLGAAARGLQVRIIGKKFAPSMDRLVGYGLSLGLFVGGYLVCEHFTLQNSQLLKRRLFQLREQRAQLDAFHEFDQEAEFRVTPQKRKELFWELIDSFGQKYK